LLSLFLMALLRIQRAEQLKERDPAAFGRLLGLDRAPEVKMRAPAHDGHDSGMMADTFPAG
jgi:hypothetical protein